MIMVLCLMVYSYSQYFLREALEKTKQTVNSQTGKPTSKPSMKWVYKLFYNVSVLKIQIGTEITTAILNLNDELRKVIILFGNVACKIYDVNPNHFNTE